MVVVVIIIIQFGHYPTFTINGYFIFEILNKPKSPLLVILVGLAL